MRDEFTRADLLERSGRSADAAAVRLAAATRLVRAPDVARLARHAEELQQSIVLAMAAHPSEALAVFAELARKSPAAASDAMTAAVVRAWTRSPATQYERDRSVVAEALAATGRDVLEVLLDVCRAGHDYLTPTFRRGVLQHLRDHLDSTLELASGRGGPATQKSPAFQLLNIVLPQEAAWADQLCALGDLALARKARSEALARYRTAAEAGSSAARQRLAQQEAQEGYRLLRDGDAAVAYGHLSRACQLHDEPDYALLRAVAGILSTGTDHHSRRNHLEDLERLGAFSRDAVFWRAIVHYQRGETRAAATLLRQLQGTDGETGGPWGPRDEGGVLLDNLEGDDGSLVDRARQLVCTQPEDWPVAGPVDPWPVVAAVARRDQELLAEMMAQADVASQAPHWARLAGARALLTRGTELASKGLTDQAMLDVESAARLVRSAGKLRGTQESSRLRLRRTATTLRIALTRPASPDEEAYAALSKDGELHPWTARAEGIWAKARGYDPWRRHHLAVLCHARAFDLENAGHLEAVQYWARGLEHWTAVHGDNEFWVRLERHLSERMGKEIDPSIVARARERLPRALLEPHRALIVAHKARRPDLARAHLAIMLSAPFASDTVDAVRVGLVREVLSSVPGAISAASYEPILQRLEEWLAVDPSNSHLLQALLTVNRSASERILGADDELAQIGRNVTRSEQFLRPALDMLGVSSNRSAGSRRQAAARLERFRPAVPSVTALRSEIGRHEFWKGFIAMREAERLCSDAGEQDLSACEDEAERAVGNFALAREMDPQLVVHPLYQQVDELEGTAEVVWGLCLRSSVPLDSSDLDRAAQHFRRAITLMPNQFEPYLLLGQTLARGRDHSSAAPPEAWWAAARAGELLPASTGSDARAALRDLMQELHGTPAPGGY